jgi:hypothetical protein
MAGSGGFYTAGKERFMTESQILGFIGTGVMGEPMRRNLAVANRAGSIFLFVKLLSVALRSTLTASAFNF